MGEKVLALWCFLGFECGDWGYLSFCCVFVRWNWSRIRVLIGPWKAVFWEGILLCIFLLKVRERFWMKNQYWIFSVLFFTAFCDDLGFVRSLLELIYTLLNLILGCIFFLLEKD